MTRWLHHLWAAIKHLLTAKDNQTYAPARVYWCLGALQFIVLAAWSVVIHEQPFNATDYGTGIGLVLTAGGVGVWLTQKSDEPPK